MSNILLSHICAHFYQERSGFEAQHCFIVSYNSLFTSHWDRRKFFNPWQALPVIKIRPLFKHHSPTYWNVLVNHLITMTPTILKRCPSQAIEICAPRLSLAASHPTWRLMNWSDILRPQRRQTEGSHQCIRSWIHWTAPPRSLPLAQIPSANQSMKPDYCLNFKVNLFLC